MENIIGFSELNIGQRVTVKGVVAEEKEFNALEISMKAPEEKSVLIGMVQGIDAEARSIRILNSDINLNGVEIRDQQGNPAQFDDLDVGKMIKVRGKYVPENGVEPKLVKMRETLEFNIYKIKGLIDEINNDAKTVKVNGYTVHLNEKTAIDTF